MDNLTKEIKLKTIGYIMTALGLVAGLAWNDAIKTLIGELFPMGTDTLVAKFIYALIITGIVVLVSMYIVKSTKEK